jgi:hypothetical protein
LHLAAVPTLLFNVSLPIVAGIARSLGEFLDKPARWDELEYEIRLRRLAIRRLQRYIPPPTPPTTAAARSTTSPTTPAVRPSKTNATIVGIVLVAIGVVATTSRSARAIEASPDACLYLVDPTRSTDSGDRDIATDFLATTALDQATAVGCRLVAVEAIGSSGALAPRTWIPVPEIAHGTDCDAEGANAGGRDLGPVSWFKNVNAGLRSDCESRLQTKRAEDVAKSAAFVAELRRALTMKSTSEWSRIREAIQGALDSNRFRLIIVVTDGIENPDGPVILRIPDRTTVIMVVTRPSNPHLYARSRAFARRWSAETRLLVVSVGDLGPGFWAATGGSR